MSIFRPFRFQAVPPEFSMPRFFLLTFCTKSFTLRLLMYRTSIGEKA